MYNLRYHIASLVAVFLSLSIGLLLGTIVVERGTLDNQREAIIEALQDEFRTLSERNDFLSAETEAQEDYINATLPLLVGNKLDGRTVMVISNAGRTDGLGSITDSLRMAGAVPVTTTFNEPSLGLASGEISSITTAATGPMSLEEIQASAVATLVAEWTTPSTSRPLTSELVMSGVMAMGELAPEASVDAVVVMAAWDEGPDELALALADGLVMVGGSAAGAEATTQQTGVAVAAVERGLSAVDAVDHGEGQLSLVLILSGEAEGYFGVGAGAQARYPTISPQAVE